MNLVRVYPNREVFEGLTAEEQSWVIARDYGICNGWRLNIAIDSSGNSFGETGVSDDVSTELDRLLLGKLRSLSDVIVTSGRTARAEKYRSSRYAPIAIFTSSGDLDSVPAIQGKQYFTPLVLTPMARSAFVEASLSDVDVRILPYEQPSNVGDWPISIASIIQREGYQSPILESGQSTLCTFLEHQIIDEICVSITRPNSARVSARDLSASSLSRVFGNMDGFALKQLFTDGRTTFSRWVRSGVAAMERTA